MKNPVTSEEWYEAWQSGDVTDHTFALYVSKTLGELSEQKTEIDNLKEYARALSGRGASIPGFEIGPPSSYEQTKADAKALLALEDTIASVNPELWVLIQNKVLSTVTVSRAATVKFVGSKKATLAEQKRKERNAERLAKAKAEEDDLL